MLGQLETLMRPTLPESRIVTWSSFSVVFSTPNKDFFRPFSWQLVTCQTREAQPRDGSTLAEEMGAQALGYASVRIQPRVQKLPHGRK